MKIGENIRIYRENILKISQGKVEKLCGLPHRYLGAIERGEKTPTIETLLKISQAFGITVSELIGESAPELTDEQRALLDNSKNLNEEQLSAIINLISAFSINYVPQAQEPDKKSNTIQYPVSDNWKSENLRVAEEPVSYRTLAAHMDDESDYLKPLNDEEIALIETTIKSHRENQLKKGK